MECAKKEKTFTLPLDLIVLLVAAVVFTARCSFPLPAAHGWREYRGDRFGYGVMIPADRKVQTPPVTGQMATMTIMNDDSSEVARTGLWEKK